MLKFFIGVIVGTSISTAVAQEFYAKCEQGTLKGYVVQYKGENVCEDPGVWNNFRGPTSYIVCFSEDGS